MHTLPRPVDLHFFDTKNVLSCGLIRSDHGVLLVDPGPSSTLDALEAGLRGAGHTMEDVRALLLTHIHLDHAGATGTLVRRYDLPVYVHRKGARHLADPERLLASAKRLYDEMMDVLWGTFEAVPEANLHPLDGGETLEADGRVLDVAYTPGHAVHHVSYFDRLSGTAFVGDTVGMACPPSHRVLPVTPPPDVDLEAWPGSLARIAAWQPDWLFRMHAGLSATPHDDLASFRRVLDAWAERVRADLRNGQEPDACAESFRIYVLDDLERELGEAAAPYRAFLYPEASWHGLARALRD